MNDLGNQHALHALRERRASLDGELRECERRLRYLKEMLGHLDATLGLLDPSSDPKAIKAKRPYKRVKLFGAGKLNRLILDALRRANGPLSTQGVIDAVVADVGIGPDAVAGMRGRIRSNLLYLAKVRGSVVKEGERETARWSITG